MAIGQDQEYSAWLAANKKRLSEFEERINSGQQLTNTEQSTIKWLKQLNRKDYLMQRKRAGTLTQVEHTELQSIIANELAVSNEAFYRELQDGDVADRWGGYRKRKLMKSKKYKKSKKSKKSKRYKKITRRRQR